MNKIRLITLGLTAIGFSLIACQSNSSKREVIDSEKPVYTESKASFNDVEIPDLSRNNVSLISEIRKNKITIIDFWASWCGPCRREMPNMKTLYSTYKAKGLGIIGVSLDKDYSQWKQAIDDMGMTWIQVSELRGWDDYTAKAYRVEAIPHTIIVNEKAEIISEGLQGEELYSFVNDYLNGK